MYLPTHILSQVKQALQTALKLSLSGNLTVKSPECGLYLAGSRKICVRIISTHCLRLISQIGNRV